MAELGKEIIGSWFEIKSNIENIIHLRDYFKLIDTEMKNTITKLHISIEEGIIEYKKQAFNKAFYLIKSLNFDAKAIPLLKETANDINCLTYVILLQRLISKKAIKSKTSQNESNTDEEKHYSVEEVGEIIKETQDAIKKQPGLKSNKNVTNILIQVQKYKKELESIKKILPHLPADKQENFRANSKSTINEIFSKLVISYEAFIKETNTSPENTKKQNIFETYDFLPIAELFKKQAEISDKIKTTFLFADRERFKILETVHTLKTLEEKIKELLKKEYEYYHNVSLSEAGKREVSRQFCIETIKILEKQLEAIS
ncbi:MAG: hypothetical protein FWC36_08110 [Spirochaetes bacterium]|nr:hypothetical protein [Spirochaetota bacterium]